MIGGKSQRLRALIRKEMHHIQRDPQLLSFALALPLVLLLLFGYAISFDIEAIPMVVVDGAPSSSTRAVATTFAAGGLFDYKQRVASPDDAMTVLRQGTAKAALIIDNDFERALLRGDEALAQLLLDGSDNNTASIALGYAQALARTVASAPGISRAPPVEARVRTLFNPGLRSALFIIPGLIAFICAIAAVMLTALTVAREFESGSMEQLFATPVGRFEIILGKLLPYFVLAILQVLLVVTAGVLLFSVPIRGSLWLLFGVATVFVLGMLAQGLFISVVTRSQMVASQLAVFSTLLPVLLLSGFIFPITNMPVPLQWVARVLPASHFVEALGAILLRGHGAAQVAADTGAMALWLVALLGLATARFRRSI